MCATCDTRICTPPGVPAEILPRLRTGGLICCDNVLWGGRVIQDDDRGEQTEAIRAFNEKVAADRRVHSVMIALSDGLTLARKLPA